MLADGQPVKHHTHFPLWRAAFDVAVLPAPLENVADLHCVVFLLQVAVDVVSSAEPVVALHGMTHTRPDLAQAYRGGSSHWISAMTVALADETAHLTGVGQSLPKQGLHAQVWVAGQLLVLCGVPQPFVWSSNTQNHPPKVFAAAMDNPVAPVAVPAPEHESAMGLVVGTCLARHEAVLAVPLQTRQILFLLN